MRRAIASSGGTCGGKRGDWEKSAFVKADNPVASNPGPIPPNIAAAKTAILKPKYVRSESRSGGPERKRSRDASAVAATARPYRAKGDRNRDIDPFRKPRTTTRHAPLLPYYNIHR